MLARHEFAACAASPVTLDVVLTERSHWEADIEIPEWSEDLIRPMSEAWAQQTSTLDDLLESMAGAGHGVAALSFYLGLPEADVRQRAAWLGIAQPGEKALRRSTSANPWSVADVRLLVALWLDNVAPTSIAAALGRSPSGVHGKRRWLGLGVRDRKGLSERSVAECRATPLPWKPSLDVSAIEACLRRPKPGIGVIAEIDPLVQFPVEVKWALGRHKEMDERFSVLGFAGLRAPAIARAHAGRVRRAPDRVGGQQPDFAPPDRARSPRPHQRIRRGSCLTPIGRGDEAARGDDAHMLGAQSLVLVLQGDRRQSLDLPGIPHQEIPGEESRAVLRRRDGDGLTEGAPVVTLLREGAYRVDATLLTRTPRPMP